MTHRFSELYLENQLCFPLYATSRLIIKRYAPHLKALHLTYPQYLVLLTLWQYDAQSVKTIGERLFLESNTLTPLLKRLEKKQLIHRTRSTTDERTVIITLTKQGEALRNDALDIPKNIVASFCGTANLSETEAHILKTTLEKMLTALKEDLN